MGAKKKKQIKNDFYFFMQDQKTRFMREGRGNLPMDEVAELCHPLWKQLDEKEKERYKNMAKQWKEQEKHNLANKFDHQGRSLLSIENERKELEDYIKNMERQIEDTVSSAFQMGTLVKQLFYFIKFNILCETNDGKCLPCELTVVEFSLSKGVTRYLHAFIRPDDVPLGYGYAIQKNSQDSHRIDLDIGPMNTKAAKTHSWTVRKMLQMISPEGTVQEMPPLYTLEEDADKTTAMLEDLFLIAGYAKPALKNIKIFHVNQLYFRLTQELPLQARLINSWMALEKLKKDTFLYTLDNACLYHEGIDRSRFCTLFETRKWAYTISDHCCQFFEIDLIPGRHVPPHMVVSPPIPREDPVQIKIDYDKWEFDEARGRDEEVNIFGVRKTRAAPAGFTTLPDSALPEWKQGQSSLFAHERDALGQAKHLPVYVQPSAAADTSFQYDESDWEVGSSPWGEKSSPSPAAPPVWGNRAAVQPVEAPDLADSSDFPSLGGQFRGRGGARPKYASRGGGGSGLVDEVEKGVDKLQF